MSEDALIQTSEDGRLGIIGRGYGGNRVNVCIVHSNKSKAIMLSIKFKYNSNFPSHKDIHVQYEELHLDCWVDSYYLVLDQHILPEIETFAKAKMVQKQIFENWCLMVENTEDNESIILPYELSDEYVGVLHIRQIGSFLEIARGSTQKYQGYSFIPSLIKYLPFELSDLRLETFKDTIAKNDFIKVLRTLQAEL